MGQSPKYNFCQTDFSRRDLKDAIKIAQKSFVSWHGGEFIAMQPDRSRSAIVVAVSIRYLQRAFRSRTDGKFRNARTGFIFWSTASQGRLAWVMPPVGVPVVAVAAPLSIVSRGVS